MIMLQGASQSCRASPDRYGAKCGEHVLPLRLGSTEVNPFVMSVAGVVGTSLLPKAACYAMNTQ